MYFHIISSMAASPVKILGILGQGGVISAPDRQPQKAGDPQGRQSHGAGSGGLDMGKILFITIIEDLQKRRMEQFLLRVFRQMEDPDGDEIANPWPLRPSRGIAGDDGIFLVGA